MKVKRISGFPRYMVSKTGNLYTKWVRGYETFNFIPIKGTVDHGYQVVRLISPDGRVVKVGLHRAVLLAWVGKPPKGKPYACHRNGDKQDNRLENLYWGSPKQNSQDSVKHGTTQKGGKNVNTKMTEYDVLEIRYAYFNKEATLTRLAELYHLDVSTVHDITSGKTWGDVHTEYVVPAARHTEAVLDPDEVMYPIPHLKNKYITNKSRVLTKRGKTLKVMTIQTDRPSMGPYVSMRLDGTTKRIRVQSLKHFIRN